jgi:DNA-binding transcriptional LysR family regulator
MNAIDIDRVLRRVRLRDLHTLKTVVESGGMRKAAERLHLSQPAVSKAVAELEDALGVALLDRSRRGTVVTASGEALLRRASVMFDELGQGLRDLDRLCDPGGGEVNLACSEVISAGLVPIAMERMSRQYPRISFTVDTGESAWLLSRYLLGRVSDFVITRPPAPVTDPDVLSETLFHERLLVVVGRSSRWATRRKLDLSELAHEPWILARTETAGADSPVIAAFRAARLSLPRQLVLTSSLNLRYRLLATGRFVTVMPQSLLRFGTARTVVKVLPVEIGRWSMPTMVLSLASRSLAPAARTMLEIVRELSAPLAD